MDNPNSEGELHVRKVFEDSKRESLKFLYSIRKAKQTYKDYLEKTIPKIEENIEKLRKLRILEWDKKKELKMLKEKNANKKTKEKKPNLLEEIDTTLSQLIALSKSKKKRFEKVGKELKELDDAILKLKEIGIGQKN